MSRSFAFGINAATINATTANVAGAIIMRIVSERAIGG